MSLAPVVLFVYSRVDTLSKTVDALKKNILASESDLFIFSDGPKEGKENDVNEVRAYIHGISGFKNIKIYESPINMGLANSVLSGVTSIINRYGKVIVVEDDLITSPYFLKYMNDSLDMYETTLDVACICGYMYPIDFSTNQSNIFIRGADCWGWGTWKRCWDLFERDAIKLMSYVTANSLESYIDFENSYPYYDMLVDQIEGRIDSWAILWLISSIKNKQFCLYPVKSLVQNVGSGTENSTHSKDYNRYLETELDLSTKEWSKIPVYEDPIIFREFARYLRRMSHYRIRKHMSYYKYIRNCITDKFPFLSPMLKYVGNILGNILYLIRI